MNKQIFAGLPGVTRVHLIFVALIALGAVLRLAFFDAQTLDNQISVLPWFEQLTRTGFHGLGMDLYDAEGRTMGSYAPPYYYLLLAGAAFDGLVSRLWIVKLITVAFEVLGAFFAYKIVRLRFSNARALVAAATVWLAPTVFANGAWWGQCDMIWASLLMGSFYFTLQRKPIAAVAMFAVAFAFKAQAFFYAPFLFMLLLRGELNWRAILIGPLVFVLMMAPAVLAGQSWEHVLTVYLRQGNRFDELSMNAPNLYYFVRYNLDIYAMGVVVGLIVTAIVSAVLAYLPRVRKIVLSQETLLLAATTFLALSPFLLPKMHDRYFFAADMFSILLAFYLPRLWFVPVFLQMSSLAAYVPIIITSLTGHMDSWALPFAAMLNAVTIAYIVVQYVRTCLTPNAQFNVARPFIVAWITVILVNLDWLVVAAGHALAIERFCPSPGVIDALICQREIPLDVKWGTWRHWLIYAALFAISLIIARLAVDKTQHWPWERWTQRGQEKLRRVVLDNARPG